MSRPHICTATAKRMVLRALGLSVSLSSKDKEKEEKTLKEEREKHHLRCQSKLWMSDQEEDCDGKPSMSGGADEDLPDENNEQHVKAMMLKNSGNEKFNKSNYKGAIIDYKKGLLFEQSNCDLHANLSAAYLHLEKNVEAEEHARYSIYLKPTFYKGYMRAAKAAHGKGMTRIALRHLHEGLGKVTDPTGMRELKRLQAQYNSFISLESNAEREMIFDSDTYESDEEDGSDDDSDPPPPQAPKAEPAPPSKPKATTKTTFCAVSKEEPKHKALTKTTYSAVSIPEPKEERKKEEEQKKDHVKPVEPDSSATHTQDRADDGSKPRSDKSPDRFLEMCKELTKDPDLKTHVTEFKEHLKNGSQAFLSGNFLKAVKCFKTAQERVGVKLADYDIDDRKYHVIKYAQCAAHINLNTYDDIVKGIQLLNEMKVYEFSIPTIHIMMAKAYYKLNRFKTALEPLEKLQQILDNHVIFPSYYWPGTNEIIVETTPAGLKDTLKTLSTQCRMSHKPTAVCRFDNCLKISTHVLPSELIYTSDPDFTGYVRMICEEKCHIEFHIPCWKAYKESVCGIGKISDKDFLGRGCLTTDCVNNEGDPSVVSVIEIVGPDGHPKSSVKMDPKTVVDSKKSRKRKAKLDDKERDKEKKDKDDKEKISKPKKPKDKKSQEEKKKLAAVVEDEEEPQAHSSVDAGKLLDIRLKALAELREINFGLGNNDWNPSLPYYGRKDETEKACCGTFTDSSTHSVEVRDAKEFVFSYFDSTLKEEGPVKLKDIEDLWKSASENFFDINVVLPDTKNMCEVLLESTRFCQVEDYICLSSQLNEAYEMVKIEVPGTYMLLYSGENEEEVQKQLHPRDAKEQPQSEDESDEEYISGTDSDESDEDTSEEDLIVEGTNSGGPSSKEPSEEPMSSNQFDAFAHKPMDELPKPKQKQKEEGKLSLQDVLRELDRIKDGFMQPDTVVEELNFNVSKEREDSSSGTYETAQNGCSLNTTLDTKAERLSDGSDKEESVDLTNEQVIIEGPSTTEQPILEDDDVTITEGCSNAHSSVPDVSSTDNQEPGSLDKASQIEVVTQERTMQTNATNTKDELSQTKEADASEDSNNKMLELSHQLATTKQECKKLSTEISNKDLQIKQLKKEHSKAIEQVKEDARKNLEKSKADTKKVMQDLMHSEITKKENEWKKKEDGLNKNISQLKELYSRTVAEFAKHKEDMSKVTTECNDLKQTVANTMASFKDAETKCQKIDSESRLRMQHFQKMQLQTLRAYWESKINLLSMRCVEKISEMQSWFTMVPPDEVEDLPSWGAIQQNILQWSEINKNVQVMKANFQTNYNMLDARISTGDLVEDLSVKILPNLPTEPTPLPLDRLHREITEKYVKKISELTNLVGSQQLEIEKIKEASHKTVQPPAPSTFSPFQHPPPYSTAQTRMQTTAFGSLALQYPPYHQMPAAAVPYRPPITDFTHPDTLLNCLRMLKSASGSLPLQSSQPLAANGVVFPSVPPLLLAPENLIVPPPSQDASKSNPLMKADVQTLLKESSKLAASFQNTAAITNPLERGQSQSPLFNFGLPPPVNKLVGGTGSTSSAAPPPSNPTFAVPASVFNPTNTPVPIARPVAPSGVAQHPVKSSYAVREDIPPVVFVNEEPKSVSSSSSSTPVPQPQSAVPTPEKTKKKKKSRAEKEAMDQKADVPLSSVSPAFGASVSGDDAEVWNVVGQRIKFSGATAAPLPTTITKTKNKQKLLEKLQQRFRTTPLKDLDDIVKLVREQNNGSLSGLPLDEIETRVERIITKRLIQKNSTMGLDKFSQAAWGTVKQPQSHAPHMRLEDCTICLDPMGNDRTTLDCNHEYDTKCIREWLSRDRTCPLCKKFTTMPDEFPAL